VNILLLTTYVVTWVSARASYLTYAGWIFLIEGVVIASCLRGR
jgi:hypothetical protein